MEPIVCRCCGMIMRSPQEVGTNADNSWNDEYCISCYKNGAFTNGMTMDEMDKMVEEKLKKYPQYQRIKW